MIRREFPKALATRRPLGHLLRSGLGAAAMFFSFSAVAFLPVAEATLLVQLAPIFMALGGVLLLGERFSFYRAGAIVLALAGMAVLVVPNLNSEAGDGRLLGYVLGTFGRCSPRGRYSPLDAFRVPRPLAPSRSTLF
ncbi:hypothetical protein HSBAA_05160 [Vreelandella sulfidaeris]|uniref:EamA domain-containing protein n=1 Tax=Vreelandella sulfidaeris TaxID=115553 RepID=A0A455U019_9GAMM|nr:hypothetical protein HSBAA_05160 [Halomonas sulfidaeris]